MMADKRGRVKLAPPTYGRMIQAQLTTEQYRQFYELAMEWGLSGADTIRRLIRAAHNDLESPDV